MFVDCSQYMETQAYQYQVPQMTMETQTVQVPRTVMVPQTTYETQTYQTQKPVYETKYRTVKVPRVTYEEVQVPYQEQVICLDHARSLTLSRSFVRQVSLHTTLSLAHVSLARSL